MAEIVDNVNVFPTEVQSVRIADQNNQLEISEKTQPPENTIDSIPESKNEESQQQNGINELSNSINETEESQEPQNDNQSNDSPIDNSNSNDNTSDKETENSQQETSNQTQPELSSLISNKINILNDKRAVKTSPQTGKLTPLCNRKGYQSSSKPRTTSTKIISKPLINSIKRGPISALKADRSLPKSIKTNPAVTKRYGLYSIGPINSKPPRAALKSSEYNPKPAAELGEIAQQILEGKSIDQDTPEEDIKLAKSQLKDLELELTEKCDYVTAKKVAAAFDYTERYLNRSQTFSKLKENIESLLSKRNELMAYLDFLNHSIDQQLEESKSVSEARLKELENQQMLEVQEFDQNVPTELTKEFRHETKDYLELRIKQRSLAKNRDFDGAQKLKEKADKIEESQIQGDIVKMKKFYKLKRKNLLRKHRMQLQCMMDDISLREKEIIHSRKIEIDATHIRIAALDDEVKKKCEEKGIKMSELNETLVDEQRVDSLISRHNETRYAKLRARSESSCYSSSRYSLRQPLPPLPVQA